MSEENLHMQILEMIESGKITADEGLHLIQVLSGDEVIEAEELVEGEIPAIRQPESGESVQSDTTMDSAGAAQGSLLAASGTAPSAADKRQAWPADAEKWRAWWMIPLWAGVGVTVASGLLMYWILQTTGLSFWFFFAGTPLIFGVLLISLAWSSRTARWLHLRVEQKGDEWPQRIAISFPLPLRLASWFLRNYGHHIQNLQGTSLDEILLALENTASPANPLYIEVEDEEDGERVEIYIG